MYKNVYLTVCVHHVGSVPKDSNLCRAINLESREMA